ncbi:Fic family protein [Marinifilum fragile]|uniref:Fic family protein n=1 Tax=Marinifilum fragile TaxID=570161 RepID=UPI002AA7D0A6|nr:Fic family protein [Marinifilum fragile]
MNQLLKKYKSHNYSLSYEEERDLLCKYVYYTNKLEGNQLSLQQTKQLLDSETISGDNIRVKDILEHKGMYRALIRMINAVHKKEELTLDLLIELNGLLLEQLWYDDSYYYNSKKRGEKIFSLKNFQNEILIYLEDGTTKKIVPQSTPKDVEENVKQLLRQLKSDNKPVTEKAADLAYQIWLHQPFVDGNKRTGRLLINFLTMKEDYPIFVYSRLSDKTYNQILINEYLNTQQEMISVYIENRLFTTIKERIEIFNKFEKTKF